MGSRVLISGAGIAGLTAAYWLEKQGWEVVMIERAPEIRRGEFVIDFAGTGWDVAQRMGLEPAINERRSPLKQLCFADGQGEPKAKLAVSNFVDALGVRGKHASINRRDLVELLFNLVRDKVEFRYSTTILELRDEDDGAWVRLAPDAELERFDLVVGADGLHSNVRRLAFGPESEFSRYLGYQVSAFRVDNVIDQEPGVMTLYRQPSKQAGILNLGNGQSLGLFVYADPKGAHVPREKRKAELADVFRDMGGVVPAVIEGIEDETALYLDSVTQIEMPRWYKKHTVLIGDAAYCLTLVSGQGASMAMGGACFLAQELAAHEDLERGLAAYEAQLRPFVEGLQRKTRRLAGSFVPSGSFGLLVSQWGMQAMGLSWVRNLAASRMSIRSLLDAA